MIHPKEKKRWNIIMLKKITDAKIRKIPFKNYVYDEPLGDGLYLTVRPNGRKIFTLRYTVDGKRSKFKIGDYPHITLAEAMLVAQNKKYEAQEVGNLHTQKVEEQKEKQRQIRIAEESNFSTLLEKYTDEMVLEKKWSEKYLKTQNLRIKKYITPHFENKPINEIRIKDVDACLKEIIAKGSFEVGIKVARIINGVYEHADTLEMLHENNTIMLSRIKRLIAKMPRGEDKPRYQALSDKEIAKVMKDLDSVKNRSQQVATAIQLAPYLALRPQELCSLEWKDIDFNSNEIYIPAIKMKQKRDHIVPLSSQAVKIIGKMDSIRDRSGYVFFSNHIRNKGHIRQESLLKVLRDLGYNSSSHTENVLCTHGFRGMFSTICHQDLKLPSHLIEFQLAHAEKNKVKASYNQLNVYSYLDERKELMQVYANHLDLLKNSH